MITGSDLIRYGIANLIRMIIAACHEKHKHYAPTISVFSAWAQVLEKHLPEMEAEARSIHG